ncbi:putative membrane protein [Candidatus Phytoplasma solani]|uniref:hypothetical protein n=1 Tax=Candidatus Phytoplasma solani TaxID=69896 RepID=UPI0032D9C7EE
MQTQENQPTKPHFTFISNFIETIYLISIQVFIIYLTKITYPNFKIEELKKLKLEIIPFVSIIAIVYFQLNVFLKLTKLFQVSKTKSEAFKEIRKQYFNQLIKKFENNEAHKKQIASEEMEKVNKILLQKNNELNENYKKITKLNEEIAKSKLQLETKKK